MKKVKILRSVLVGLLFIVLTNSYGQSNVSNDTLHWSSNRPLSWNDFKGEPLEGVGLLGEVFCMNLANFEKPNPFQKPKFKVVALFDRTKSWIDKDSKSEEALVYFQIMFNIYEVHARSLRKDLAESKFGANPNPLFQEKYNNSMTNLTNEFNMFRRETKLGLDTKAIIQWKLKVEEELRMLEDYKK